MAELQNSKRVQYECSCGEWFSLSGLYYCINCSALRCEPCVKTELDLTYCPNCFEAGAGDASSRMKKNRCYNCYQCPLCESMLVTRAAGDMCHLVCATCRWSTKESDTPEHPTSVNWPQLENPLHAELEKVAEKMRTLGTAEKNQKDMSKHKRRSTNVGAHMADRYGLQSMYQKRKKTFEMPVIDVPVHETSEQVPPLCPEVMDGTDCRPSLDEIIRQPLAIGRKPGPVRVVMKTRKTFRCTGCDRTIVKLDYGPCTTKFKIAQFARRVVPVVSLSREPQMTVDQAFPVMISITNASAFKSEVLLMGDAPCPEAVECLSEPVQFTLLTPDDAADICAFPSERIERILTTYEERNRILDMNHTNKVGIICATSNLVFNRRHRAGVRLDVRRSETTQNRLDLILKWKNELCFVQPEGSKPVNLEQMEYKLVRIRISLDGNLQGVEPVTTVYA